MPSQLSQEPTHTRREYGALSLLLAIVSGQAAHWLIAPHPGASTARTVFVVVQLFVSAGFFVWAFRKERQLGRAGRVGGQGGQ
jgi:hypothetical protein